MPTATAGCTPTLVKLGGKPRGIYSDPAGNLFIAGYGDNKVYVVRASDAKLYLVAGSGTAPTNTTDPAGDGGPASAALLKGPRAVASDAAGNVYIADSGDNRIREVLSSGLSLPGTPTSRPSPAPAPQPSPATAASHLRHSQQPAGRRRR